MRDDLQTIIRLLAVVLHATVLVVPAVAQTGMIPTPCVGKSGEALDKCVRDITPFEPPRVYATESAPDPKRPINCKAVHVADRNFCIARNEIIIECGNRRKHADFDQCFLSHIGNPPLPGPANCSRLSGDKAAECNLRNKVYKACTQDRTRYFDCLAEKMKR